MSKYKIDWLEQKTTSTGKLKADATVTDESGVQTDKVTIWGDFPNFAALKPGSEVLAELDIKQNGKFTNKTLKAERTNTMSAPRAPAWAGGGKGGAVEAAKLTSKSVSEAMAQKQEGIERSAVIRDSTLITVALINAYAAGKIIDTDAVKKDWQNWRKFFEGEFADPGQPF